MAYYTALIAAWTAGTVPNGVTGSALTGQTTANKLVNINAWTITGVIPATFYCTGAEVFNAIDKTEFLALAATQQQNLLLMCSIPGPLLSGSGDLSRMVPGLIISYFTNQVGPTITALIALAKSQIMPWASTPVALGGAGLNGPTVNYEDLRQAGGLT